MRLSIRPSAGEHRWSILVLRLPETACDVYSLADSSPGNLQTHGLTALDQNSISLFLHPYSFAFLYSDYLNSLVESAENRRKCEHFDPSSQKSITQWFICTSCIAVGITVWYSRLWYCRLCRTPSLRDSRSVSCNFPVCNFVILAKLPKLNKNSDRAVADCIAVTVIDP